MRLSPARTGTLRRSSIIAAVAAGLTSVGLVSPSAGLAASAPLTLTGEQPYFTYAGSQALDNSTGIAVNVASGDLLVQGQDVRIAGTGLDLNIARAYNSESSEGATDFGGLWSMESAADVKVVYNKPVSGDATFYGPSGYANVLTPNGSGGFTAANGLNATLVHNSNGTSTLTFFETGEVYNFNTAGQLTSDVDKHGNTVSYGYSGANLSTITDTRKRTLNVTTNSSGQITKIADPTGRSWNYGYTGGDLTSSTDAVGNKTTYAYTGTHLLSTITDPDGNQTQITYGSGGQVASISRAPASNSVSAEVTKFSYNLSPSSPCPSGTYGETTVTNPDSANTIYCWDSTGRVISTQNADGHSSTQVWGADDLPSTGASPDQTTAGVNTTLTYSSGSNALTGITQGTGANTSIQQSLSYNTGSSNTDPYKAYDPSSATDAQGNTTSYGYDSSGNMTSVQNPLGSKDTLTYNAQGELTGVTDPDGHSRSYSYDSLGQLTTLTPPQPSSIKATTITYDGLSRIATVTDGKGQKSTYAYDANDRVSQVTYADGSTVTYSYNGDGDETSETTVAVPQSAQKITYTYDNLNRQTQGAYPTGYTDSYGYDAAGQLTSFTDGGGTVTYVYDPAGLLTSLTDTTGKTTFGYNNDGQRTSTTYPDGTTETLSVNPADQVTAVSTTNPNSASALTSDSYTYGTSTAGNPDGLLIKTVDNLGNTTTDSYDSANELTNATATNSAKAITDEYQYTYDPAGNHTKQITMYNSSATTTQSLAYNAANQICWSIVGSYTPTCSSPPSGATIFSYDADGNELGASNEIALTWNAENQVTSEQDNPQASVAKYAYLGAGQGDRVQDGATTFENSNLGLSASTTSGSNTVYYTRDPSGLIINAHYNQSPNYYHYIYDSQGDVIALDKNGALSRTYKYEVDGAGGVVQDTGSNFDSAIRFHGAWNGSGNEYHFGARDYDPTLREWTQEDPLDQPEDLSQENAYDYVGNDPVNLFDPTGQDIFSDAFNALKSAGNAVADSVENVFEDGVVKGILKIGAGVECGNGIASISEGNLTITNVVFTVFACVGAAAK